MRGETIKCSRCNGFGLVSSFYQYPEPDECSDCGGSGVNWLYPGGAIAKYYSGPLIGRQTSKEAQKKPVCNTCGGDCGQC